MTSTNTTIPSYDTCKSLSPTCSIEYTFYGTPLSKPAPTFFFITFALLLHLQLYHGIKSRTWSYALWLGIDTLFECLGYFARAKLAENPWSMNAVMLQILTLLLAPTLVAAAISVTFEYLVIWYGSQWSVMRPSLYPWVFVGSDFVSIVVQVIGGGAMAAGATGNRNETVVKIAEKAILGGVAFQVGNMVVCASLMMVYVARRKSALKRGGDGLIFVAAPHPQADDDDVRLVAPARENGGTPMSRALATPQRAGRARTFAYALGVAYVAIIIRCAYRITENVPAISKEIMRNEPMFLGLDGAMLLIAIGAVTLVHPGVFSPFLSEKPQTNKGDSRGGDYQMRNMK
ncbi:RTA1 like protein [Colletotrichum phormii]|uniref:RTA1 like protein n=1 Tax=Colletotrichum phormii TaxID=359342 RepID=A0AAJ0EJ42_9PEZI|nr:RTA1 like protein [Colletotrichum phormii]KAK1638666.1 RTA1 like protein [Colletotrichum phormii]